MLANRRLEWAPLVVLLSALACSGKERAPPLQDFVPNPSGNGGTEELSEFRLGEDDPNELPWDACARRTGDSDTSAECVTVAVPTRRDVEEPALQNFFVKRWKARAETRGSLWLLQGGPGVSGVSLEDLAALVTRVVPDLDIYIPDHRGTGRSQLFECTQTVQSDEEDLSAALRDCAEEISDAWLQDSAGFRTTEAAWDVIEMIRATRGDGPVLVHGGSYGGYWLHRVMQLDPEAVQAAVFESSALPQGQQSMTSLLLDREQAGLAVLEACDADEYCSTQLGSDAAARAREILAGIDDCDALSAVNLDAVTVRQALTNALLLPPTALWVPGMLARAAACREEDAEFLSELISGTANLLTGPQPSADVADSIALLFHINLSEIHPTQVDSATLEDAASAALFPEVAVASALNDALSYWPLYEKEAPEGQLANVDTDILILHGTFDPRTDLSVGRALAEQFSAENQHYFEFPYVGHGVVYGSHATSAGSTCGLDILAQFLTAPGEAPDGSCIQNTPAPDFAGNTDLLEDLTGTEQLWPNP